MSDGRTFIVRIVPRSGLRKVLDAEFITWLLRQQEIAVHVKVEQVIEDPKVYESEEPF